MCYRKLFTYVESHVSAVSLLKSREQRYIKALNNNNSQQESGIIIFYDPAFCFFHHCCHTSQEESGIHSFYVPDLFAITLAMPHKSNLCSWILPLLLPPPH